MRIPQRAVGKAIGRGGETIKRLKDELSTFIQVDQTTSDQGFSTFKISGPTADSVEAAISHLKGVVLSCEPCECLYPDDVEEEVEVPADKVGTVIGPQGCVLDEVRRRSGCRVQLQPVEMEDGSPRSAKVVGTADAVRVCVDLLNDVISGAFDVSSVINRQKAHYQRLKSGTLGGGKGKGKGKGKGGGGGGGGYWNANNSAAAGGPGGTAMGGLGNGGNMVGQQNLNYPTSMGGFVPPQVMYSPQMFAAASQGMLSPHMAATASGPIPPYLMSMFTGYQQPQQQQSPSGGPGISAAELTRQMQQGSATQSASGGTAAGAASNSNQYLQQQQPPMNMPISPQGIITPQQVMAVHQTLWRGQQQQQQQNEAAPEVSDTSTPTMANNDNEERGQTERS
ncbi:conserved hypothetical protein [Perkinsus marinus ATCC 50983]|uniref:K Homology domain-containing protein n=1 Tax=Perkinsus marinus (strain ATCC 50983 / TXsc) TaxID=423536 RepID=C5LVN2_PERM5|nr:conserved hypothetical protein [Perkinsus marinus ATCC 50983]EEQ99155.1 conserved hypothetical protein [Perkinsus marinus ATCC 50983]|eukprot:XP_002766438.1 conserved hypothetical protein [Perkinsus marinus ATCC 50983]